MDQTDTGPRTRLGVEPLLSYNKLPSNLQTAKRRTRALANELWLDERQLIIIDPESADTTFECRITTSDENDSDNEMEDFENDQADVFFIREIVYFSPNSRHPAIRSASHRRRLPSECHRPRPPPRDGMKHLKFFLDLFVDDFGPYRNVYHSLGGGGAASQYSVFGCILVGEYG